MENNKSVMEYYESYNENERLNMDSLEFIRIKDILKRNLPQKPVKIMDLCGASGHYAYWLAEMGHEVHLMDLSPKNINDARNNQTKYNARLASISCGDARALDYENESFDMVLLMGALYHLQEREDRLLCLKEARRILKIMVSLFLHRYTSMLDGFIQGRIYNIENNTID